MNKDNNTNSDIFANTPEDGGNNPFSFDQNVSSGGSVFNAPPVEESNMFSMEEVQVAAEKKAKRDKDKPKSKAKVFIIIGIIVILLAGGAFGLTKLFASLGDSSIAKGDIKTAKTYYQLCLGTNGASKRLEVVKAIELMQTGDVDGGINHLLENGIVINVNYDLNGGEFINTDRKTSVTLQKKSDFGDFYKARKDYYSFVNWDISKYSYNPDFDDSLFEVNLKAIFNLNNYKISYTNLFADKIENPETYTYESDTITLKNPSRDGYKFLYWTGTDINGSSTAVVIAQGSSEDRAYTAHWEPNKYVVTMNPDVPCQIENPITVTFDDDYVLPQIEKRGYTHNGWSDGNETWVKGIWTTLNDVTVTPVWDINNYTLSYDLAGGKLDEENPDSYTVISDDIVINNPSRFGYTFQGWLYLDKVYPEQAVVIKKDSIGDVAFKAVWNANPHKINMNANGGVVSPAVLNVVFDGNYTMPTPTRTGYTFTGWQSGNGKLANSGVWSVDEDMNVNAQWTANKYSATLNVNGGQVSQKSINATFDSQYTLPTPTRYGYTFTGWYNGSNVFPLSGTWKTGSNVTLTAGWQGNPHTVTLAANGGSVAANSVRVVFGSSFNLPTPTMKGHSFTGWYSGSTKYPASGNAWNEDKDVALTAQWSVNTYSAALNLNGGSANTSSVRCKYGSSYSLPTPTRRGYTFDGWYNGNIKMQNSGTWTWDTDLNLNSRWNPNKYTVNLSANTGTVSQSSVTVYFGSAYSLPTPKKTGHSFNGWYSGSTKYSTSGTWNTDSNVSLSAQWTVNTYTATLSTKGGSVNKTSFDCKYGSSYSLPTPTRKGYTFDGWHVGSKRVANSGTWNWDENIKFIAEWEPNEYSITFDPRGGEISRTKITVLYGDQYEFPIPELKGYKFLGWYSGSTRYDTDGEWKYDGNLSLTAQWELQTYKATLDLNGGSSSTKSVSCKYNATYSLPVPTRKGYTFAGWFEGSKEIPANGSWTWDKNLILEAQWTPNSYKVTLNDGTTTSEMSVTYDASYKLPTPERAGYTFKGWYNGSSSVSASGKWSYDTNVTLTAKWDVGTFTITLDDNGGSVSTGRISVKYGASYSLPTPTKKGNEFGGWLYNGSPVSTNGTFTWSDNIKLVAKWNPITYYINLDSDGGSGAPARIAVAYGEKYSLPSSVTKPGYTFAGWYNGNSRFSISGTWTYTNDITLKVKWNLAEVSVQSVTE